MLRVSKVRFKIMIQNKSRYSLLEEALRDTQSAKGKRDPQVTDGSLGEEFNRVHSTNKWS